MSSCETPDFSDFNSCVQRNYARHPDASTVRALYAQLNAIEEDQQNGKISQIKAKAMAYTAYDATVGAGNRSSDARSARQRLRLRTCYTDQFTGITTCY
jgi:hypothetical protein